jgi:hypothetical protein
LLLLDVLGVTDIARIERINLSNSFGIGGKDVGYSADKVDSDITALYLLPSYFNHECTG